MEGRVSSTGHRKNIISCSWDVSLMRRGVRRCSHLPVLPGRDSSYPSIHPSQHRVQLQIFPQQIRHTGSSNLQLLSMNFKALCLQTDSNGNKKREHLKKAPSVIRFYLTASNGS